MCDSKGIGDDGTCMGAALSWIQAVIVNDGVGWSRGWLRMSTENFYVCDPVW